MDQFNGWEWFYLDDEAQNIGPFTTEELQGFYQNEQFTDETYGKERNFLQFLPLLPWTNPTPPFFLFVVCLQTCTHTTDSPGNAC